MPLGLPSTAHEERRRCSESRLRAIREVSATREARLLLSALGDGTRRHLARLVTLLCRPVRWLAALALRSPLGPTLRAAVRVLGACLVSARAMLGAVLRPLSQVSAAVGAALAHAFRRRLIVVLGGTMEEQGSKGL